MSLNLKKIIQNRVLFKDCRFVYIYVFLFCILTRQISFFALLPVAIDSAIFSVLAFFGLGLVFWGIVGKNIEFKLKKNYLLLFLISTFISSLININYGIIKNLKDLVWLSIFFFVIYSFPCSESDDEKVGRFFKIQNLLTYFWGVLTICSIATYFMQISYVSYIRDDWWLRIGIVENRLFGIFNNPNCDSVISFMSMIFSIYQIKFKNKFSTKKWINISNAIIQLIYISLSESRGTCMILIMASFMVSLLFFYYKFGRQKRLKNIFLSLILSALLSIFVFFVTLLIIKSFALVNNLQQLIFGSKVQSVVVSKRVDFINNGDISNLRFKLWKDSWEIFKNNWLFGVTSGNVVNYAKINFPESLIARRNYSKVHNTWIGFLVFNGVFGAYFLFAFFIKKTIGIFKYFSKKGLYSCHSLFILCVLVFFCVCVYGMVESEILYINSAVSIIFWLSLGFITSKMPEQSNR